MSTYSQSEVARIVESVLPDIRESGDAHTTLIKRATELNLPPSVLEKAGQVYNTAKTLNHLDGVDEIEKRGNTFTTLDVPAMVEAYTGYDPKERSKPAPAQDLWSAAAFDKAASARRDAEYELPEDFNPLMHGREKPLEKMASKAQKNSFEGEDRGEFLREQRKQAAALRDLETCHDLINTLERNFLRKAAAIADQYLGLYVDAPAMDQLEAETARVTGQPDLVKQAFDKVEAFVARHPASTKHIKRASEDQKVGLVWETGYHDLVKQALHHLEMLNAAREEYGELEKAAGDWGTGGYGNSGDTKTNNKPPLTHPPKPKGSGRNKGGPKTKPAEEAATTQEEYETPKDREKDDPMKGENESIDTRIKNEKLKQDLAELDTELANKKKELENKEKELQLKEREYERTLDKTPDRERDEDTQEELKRVKTDKELARETDPDLQTTQQKKDELDAAKTDKELRRAQDPTLDIDQQRADELQREKTKQDLAKLTDEELKADEQSELENKRIKTEIDRARLQAEADPNQLQTELKNKSMQTDLEAASLRKQKRQQFTDSTWNNPVVKAIRERGGEAVIQSMQRAQHDRQAEIDNAGLMARGEAALNTLLLTDPVISEYDEEQMRDIFFTILRENPAVATDINELRGILRAAGSFDGVVDIETSKQLKSLNKLDREAEASEEEKEDK